MWSETGNHNFRLSSGANIQAILNANTQAMNANSKNFQAMLNANNKEMNANFQAMLLKFEPSASSSSFSLEAVVGIAGVAVAVVIAFAGLQERTFDRTTAELSPMKEQITQILVNSATTNGQINAINTANGNILEAINKLKPPRK